MLQKPTIKLNLHERVLHELACHGRTDLSGGDEVAIMHSLVKLAKILPPDTVCLTGHGDSTTVARELMQNPFMQM